MPMRPPRLCACGHVVTGRCTQCSTRTERLRGNSAQRGYGVRHRAWRRMVLNAHPEGCAGCYALPNDSDHADHITPLPRPNWWDGDWSLENGQRLCHACHNRKTVRENRIPA